MLDTFSMVKEISVMEQRYQAVLAVIADGRGVGEVNRPGFYGDPRVVFSANAFA
jgi:hypothetical protein